MHKLSIEAKMLINLQGLVFFTKSLASVFLNIFIFQLGGFETVAYFNAILFLMLLISYNTSGILLAKTSSKVLVASSFVLHSFFFGLLFVLKENSINYLLPLGTLFGLGAGLFWSGFNLTQYIVTHSQTRDEYFGKSSAYQKFGESLGPITGGLVVLLGNQISPDSFFGYYILFGLVCVLYFISLIYSLNLPVHKGISFSLKDILTHKRTKSWKIVLIQQFFLGLWDTSFTVLAGIVFYIVLINEFVVGSARTASALTMGLISIFAAGIIRKKPKLYLPASILTFLGVCLFGLTINIYGIILLIVFTGIGLPFINISLSSAILNSIDKNNESWQKKYHMFLERDSILGLARILSFLILFLAFSANNQQNIAINWIKYTSVFPLILAYLLYKYYQESK